MTGPRDQYIDFLRGTALLLLVVAHCSAPSLLMALRTFDVPLMVFVSALCFHPSGSYGKYCLKRLRRIYMPTALFLCMLFGLSAAFPIVPAALMTPRIIAGSFLLWNWPAIPFVWVMRVFLLVAVAIPLLHHAVSHLRLWQLAALLAAGYAVQTLASSSIDTESDRALIFFTRDYVLYLGGYSIIAAAGLACRRGHKEQVMVLGLGIVAVALHIAIDGTFDPQADKYPPSGLYLGYGCACSSGLLMLRPLLVRLGNLYAFRYLSANSMWLYLWHTIPVFVMRNFNLIPGSWVGRFCFVLVSALALHMLWCRLRECAPAPVAAIME